MLNNNHSLTLYNKDNNMHFQHDKDNNMNFLYDTDNVNFQYKKNNTIGIFDISLSL